ncbi:hypothetical protein HPB50_000861 [Hyalomma asiaticum]|uniref:Uncharacterized protein n=1 Tax=Hyalomma asiaticum TaxID=266040 RepID=A0ACB7SAP7_HYAAI|nr:hypothetical protein HPB50_000861 [Hyalomma asiaticum]
MLALIIKSGSIAAVVRLKLALEFEPQRGAVRCSGKRWWPWLGHMEFSALAPLKENKATRLHPLLTHYTHRDQDSSAPGALASTNIGQA